MKKAFDTYLQDRPEVLFLSMGLSDPQCDALIDDFVQTLEARDWMKNTVILVTAGHGGDPADGFEIPVILYGKGVTKGKVMKRTNLIYDVGATVAGLVGVKLPWECRGRFLSEAFQPADLAR